MVDVLLAVGELARQVHIEHADVHDHALDGRGAGVADAQLDRGRLALMDRVAVRLPLRERPKGAVSAA